MKHMLLLLGALAVGSVCAQTPAAPRTQTPAATRTQTSTATRTQTSTAMHNSSAMHAQTSASRSTETPTKVKSAFSEKYPDATGVVWRKVKDNAWQANFNLKGTNESARFNSEGKWTETEYKVSESAVPEAVMKTIKDQFAGYTAGDYKVKEYATTKAYLVKLKKNDSGLMVTIDPQGKVLRQKSMTETKK